MFNAPSPAAHAVGYARRGNFYLRERRCELIMGSVLVPTDPALPAVANA